MEHCAPSTLDTAIQVQYYYLMNAKRPGFTLTAAALLALAAIWIAVTGLFIPTPAAAGAAAAPREGFAAPDFTLTSLSGETVQLSALRGRVVFLNFWTSWCPPCKKEMPAIQQLSEQSPDVAVLAVNVSDQDRLEDAQLFLASNGITLDVLLDSDGSVSRLYQVEALPTSFFIDKKGIIRKIVYGGPISSALLFAETSSLAKEP